jgi:hypothetical protein
MIPYMQLKRLICVSAITGKNEKYSSKIVFRNIKAKTTIYFLESILHKIVLLLQEITMKLMIIG